MTLHPRKNARPSGMRAYLVIQAGQFVSIIGTAMSRFALTLFAWEQTNEATALALMAFFHFLPVVLFSTSAGVLVDRWPRKLTMMLSDLGAGSMTIVLLALSLTGQLQIWHIYATAFVVGAFESFQFPAYSAAISQMVGKEQYSRASAIEGMVQAAAGIIAPVLAGFLFAPLGLNGILLLDVVSFSFAMVALLIVAIPPTPATDPAKRNSFIKDSMYGFRFILSRPSLFGLQMIFFFGNFLYSVGSSLHSPMILARTGSNEQALATVNAAMLAGSFVGGVFITWWGGPRRRIYGVVSGWVISAFFLTLLFGLAQGTAAWAALGFAGMVSFPLVNASNQAIWMSKVPPAMQGRVFSVRRLVAQVCSPLGMFLAGPLADNIFEPGMRAGGALVPLFGGMFGSGQGAGMAVLVSISGVLCIASVLLVYLVPAVNQVERIIPDFESEAEALPQPTA